MMGCEDASPSFGECLKAILNGREAASEASNVIADALANSHIELEGWTTANRRGKRHRRCHSMPSAFDRRRSIPSR